MDAIAPIYFNDDPEYYSELQKLDDELTIWGHEVIGKIENHKGAIVALEELEGKEVIHIDNSEEEYNSLGSYSKLNLTDRGYKECLKIIAKQEKELKKMTKNRVQNQITIQNAKNSQIGAGENVYQNQTITQNTNDGELVNQLITLLKENKKDVPQEIEKQFKEIESIVKKEGIGTKSTELIHKVFKGSLEFLKQPATAIITKFALLCLGLPT